jgi:hypothetical protein
MADDLDPRLLCPNCGNLFNRLEVGSLEVFPPPAPPYRHFRPGALIGICTEHGPALIQEAELEAAYMRRRFVEMHA